MAKSLYNTKIAFGDVKNLRVAIENKVVDQRDLVISGLTRLPELYIVDDNLEPKRIRSYIETFDTVVEANEWLNENKTDELNGQPIAVLNRDGTRYNLYLVRVTETTIGLRPVVTLSDLIEEDGEDTSEVMSLVEAISTEVNEHITNTDNPHNVTFTQAGLEVMSDNEIIDIVNTIFN